MIRAVDSETGINKSREELLDELKICQLELEMQNEQLSYSYELIENERSKFAGFFDHAPVGYFVLDPHGKVEEVNQTGTDLLGVSKIMMRLENFTKFIDHDTRDSFDAFLSRMNTNADKQICEVKATNVIQKVTFLLLEGLKIKNEVNGTFQYYVTAIDITIGKLSQQRLLNTKQRLEMTLRASGTGTWTLDLGQRFLTFDDYCFSILEINSLDFDGDIQSFINIVHPDDQSIVHEGLRTAITDFKALDFEFRILNKRKSIKHISAKGHRVVNVSGSYFAGIIMDVTDKKRMEKERLDLHNEKQQLVLAATFDAQEKERLRISNALHDSVCQILYGIRLNLQGIKISSDKKQELNNATLLLDEAIKETRTISYELTPSVLRDFGFAAGIKEMAQRLSSSTMTIYNHVDSTIENLNTEVQLYLFRIVQELVNNCLKHSKATEVRIAVTTDAKQVILHVADNGVGFTGTTEQALFKGSGLRAIKNRIFLLGGTMDFTSSKDNTAISLRFNSNQKTLLDS
jgi:PAS domain S-box-containing protein